MSMSQSELLLAYMIAYLALAFGWRSYVVFRRTGRNPFVLPASDDAEGYVGRAFRTVVLAAVVVSVAPALAPQAADWLGPLRGLEGVTRWPGWVLLVVSFAVVLVAQAHMGLSWRIGIDRVRRTELVQDGLFARSRNPIFLSMRLTLLGLFGVMPSAATLAIVVAGEVLMQVQVRLEEAHLAASHGQAYADYRARVRRWL